MQPLPDGGRRYTASMTGGWQPRWRRDGSELFYVEPETLALMAVAVSTSGEFSAGPPERLFEYPELRAGGQYPRCDVSRDGQRFLTIEAVEVPVAQPGLQVVLNWTEELKRQVPSD